MKDLLKLDILKKQKHNVNKKYNKNNNKLYFVIILIIFLLSFTSAYKIINNHIKNSKINNKYNNEQKSNFYETNLNKRMVFTFYDNIKNDSVNVDIKPQTKKQYTYKYIYQIASFRNMNETSWYIEKMRQNGLDPQFKRFGKWIKMYIGPYNSKRDIAPDIIKLQKIGLNRGFTREVRSNNIS